MSYMMNPQVRAPQGIPVARVLRAAEACAAAAGARSAEEEMAACMRVMQERETIQAVLLNREAASYGNTLPGNERKPLVIDGDEVGHVELRIPERLFMQLAVQKNFGMDGFLCDEGIRDFKRSHPYTVAKHVSARPTISFSGRGRWGGVRSANIPEKYFAN